MTSPTGIIPESMMFASKRGAVMDFLKELAVVGDLKEQLLVAWAQAIGVRVNSSQRAAVRNTGIDRR